MHGEPKLRAPEGDVITRMQLHTTGLGLRFPQGALQPARAGEGSNRALSSRRKRRLYGSNIDWCGRVIEAIAAKWLGEVLKSRIFEPLGMLDTKFELTDSLRERVGGIHAREADGS